MNLQNSVLQNIEKLKRFIISFYIIGVAGILFPYTSPFFIALTPLALLMSFVLLIFQHKTFDVKTIAVFSLIFISGLAFEITGVATGDIFGNYSYGNTLGPKFAGTPYMMGINWMLMIYLSASVIENVKIHQIQKILLSSVIMVCYDLILEQVAPGMDMWKWENNQIPIQNFVAWFSIAILFHSLIKLFKIKTNNGLSTTILISQFLFFILLLFKFL